MSDLESKAPETGEAPQEGQPQENQGAGPVEAPFAQPPAPVAGEEGEPIPPEAQEPVYPEELPAPAPVEEVFSNSQPEEGTAPTEGAPVPAAPYPGPAPAEGAPVPATPYPGAAPAEGAPVPAAPYPGPAPAEGAPVPAMPYPGPAPAEGAPAPAMPYPGPAPAEGAPALATPYPGAAPAEGAPAPAMPYPVAPGYGAAPQQPVNWPGPQGYYPPAGGQASYGAYPGYYQPYPPQPGAPAAGAAQPAYPYYEGYGAPAPENPPKKKKPLALKIFLWIASILAAGGLIGFAIYVGLQTAPGSGGKPILPPDSSQPSSSLPEYPAETPPPLDDPEPSHPQVDVTPNTEGIQLHAKPDGQVMEPEEVYSQLIQSTVAISATLTREGKTSESHGTGIIATADGYIITNSHVVLNSKSAAVTVATYDGQEYEAVVVGVDRTTDLAVIKTNDHGFTPAEFGDADDLAMGEWVLALGNPGGTRFSNSLTRGIVSGLDREVGQYSANGMTYIQTDAAINPGNSGGPLVNLYGQVVGINSSKIVTENYEGMGFAIPVSKAQPIINELLSGGYIKGRTRLGIMCMEMEPAGLIITEFNEDSAFKGTEAQVGDIITALDGETVTSLNDVSNLLLKYAPGDQVEVTLRRPAESLEGFPMLPDSEVVNAYTELTVTITLLEDKGETQD